MKAILHRLHLTLGRSYSLTRAARIEDESVQSWRIGGQADCFPSGHYAIKLRTLPDADRPAVLSLIPEYQHGAGASDEIALRLRMDAVGGRSAAFILPRSAIALRLCVRDDKRITALHSVRLRSCTRIEYYAREAIALGREHRNKGASLLDVARMAASSLLSRNLRQVAAALRSASELAGDKSYAAWIDLYDSISHDDIAAMRQAQSAFARSPRISVVVLVRDEFAGPSRQVIDSISDQTFENWEIVIAGAALSTLAPIGLGVGTKYEQRIQAAFNGAKDQTADVLNAALKAASGEWVVIIDGDNLLAPHALFCVIEAINRHPDAQLVYSDEDKLDEQGRRCDPYFKTDWNYDLFLSHDFITGIAAFRTDRVKALGGLRERYRGAELYDLALRYIEGLAPGQIVHIPHVLCHRRILDNRGRQTQHLGSMEPAARDAIRDHLQRCSIAASVDAAAEVERMNQVTYRLHVKNSLTTIIIPTRNSLSLLKTTLDSIFERTDFPAYDILVVDNGSDDQDTLSYLAELSAKVPRATTVIRDDRPFNFSALNNAAVSMARGDYVVLLNNDVQVVSANWLVELITNAQRPGVGCVGARLYYPDMTLQHGGVVLGMGGVAGHVHKHLGQGEPCYFGRTRVAAACSAVTAACLAVSKRIYLEAGGLDENLAIAFNDVDFCLRVRERGYRNIYLPSAELIHQESKSRGYEDTPEKLARFEAEVALMKRRWGKKLLHDPNYNPNLTLAHEHVGFAFPPRIAKPWCRRSMS